jgi:diphthine-ammonia ligase
MNLFASWSGGKESALATYKAIAQGYQVSYLVNFVSEDGKRSRSHGIGAEVLALQAEAAGIPLIQVRTSWEDYEENFRRAVTELKEKGVQGGVFGDMDLEEHREWIERVCSELDIQPVLPLWKMEPEALLAEFWESGFKAIVVATRLEERLLGRALDKAFLEEVKSLNSHPCGESGEYHTLVTDGPIFQRPLKVTQGRKERKDDVWFLEISAELG